jgi:hypothetical protein
MSGTGDGQPITRAERRAAEDDYPSSTGFAQKFTLGFVVIGCAIITGMVVGGIIGGLMYLMSAIFNV